MRQGDPGFCLYFIVSGTVSVTVTRRDHRTGVYGTTTVAVLGKNEAFGVSGARLKHVVKPVNRSDAW